MELVTLKIFNTEAEAFILISLLESHNIEAYIFNNITSTVYPIFNNTIGGVEVKVKKEDFDEVIKILSTNN